ncbi:FecR domain-containing protein [Puia sp. P3]|uniref:FecR domain-containing protein n=1 Tax=Puia sp. P3 TaxID=3423952 RepID=UPI003D66ADA7
MVELWFRENPAQLKEYIGMEEWEGFQPAHPLPTDVSGRLWHNINKDAASPATHRLWFRWAAVAAAVILVVGLSWQFLSIGQKKNVNTSLTAGKTRNVVNNTPQKMAIELSDGSTVDLSPNSSLSYAEGFGSSKREVIVNGEAEFNITKDAARPFLFIASQFRSLYWAPVSRLIHMKRIRPPK